jgi:hypothetical protein
MAAVRQMLSDRGALASTLKACGLASAELKQALEIVDRKVKPVDEIGSMEAAGSIIERVELKRDGMQITVDPRALLPTELLSLLATGASIRMSRVVQMQMKRRGVETRLVIPGEAVAVLEVIRLSCELCPAAISGLANCRPEKWHRPDRSRSERV